MENRDIEPICVVKEIVISMKTLFEHTWFNFSTFITGYYTIFQQMRFMS